MSHSKRDYKDQLVIGIVKTLYIISKIRNSECTLRH